MDAVISPVKLHVAIRREMFSDYFVLILDNGHTEELEPEDTRDWFKARGANMDVVEKALDQAWNFKSSEININKPKNPVLKVLAHAPKV